MVDAVIVIKAYELKVWEPLRQGYRVIIPSIVASKEASWFNLPGGGLPYEIALGPQITDGHITEWESSPQEMADVYAHFDRAFKTSIDDGEVEALAYLTTHPDEDVCFCTADGPAIMALAMLDMAERGISFEEALRLTGQNKTFGRKDHHFTERFFQERLERGHKKRITGEGLSSDLPL